MKEIDYKKLRREILDIENEDVRDVLLAIVQKLEEHDDDLLHIFTYAEGVR